MIIRTASAVETRAVGAAIASCLAIGDVVVLTGDLGSGKTTLAQGIAAGLGVTEPVVSPTFAIVREYDGDVAVAHVDVYRLEHVQELHDLGFEEIVDGSRVVLIEWGELVVPVLPLDRVVVSMQPGDGDDDERVVDVTVEGAARSAALIAQLERALQALSGGAAATAVTSAPQDGEAHADATVNEAR